MICYAISYYGREYGRGMHNSYNFMQLNSFAEVHICSASEEISHR
jgi:hypothetical protein